MYIIFMKKMLTLKMAAIACAVFMAIGFAYAANVEEIDAPSAAMNKSIPAIVILPDSYEKSADARYPVLYLLHGFGGNASGFSDFFEELFGHRGAAGGRGRGAFRGQDIEAELQLTLREAAVTHKQTFTVGGETLRITVPAGVANGQVIKLKGHGGKGANGGPDGDLYITFVISDDPVFKRKENDLYTNVTIDLYTAVLGGEVTVNTLDGQVKLKVRPGTQNDAMVRLKGKGFPVYKQEGTFGDLIVTYHITIPTSLTEHQKELFRQLQKGA